MTPSRSTTTVQGAQREEAVRSLGHTTKGKGVSYMENVPIWHYRAPNAEEYNWR